jgi:hypothetical protein
VKQDLRGWRLGRCIFAGDAGMHSEDNRRTLALGGGKYVLAARMRAGDEVTKEDLPLAIKQILHPYSFAQFSTDWQPFKQ